MSLTVSEARALATELLHSTGLEHDACVRTADAIVLADAWGVGSHGLMRLPYYLERLRAGGYPVDADLEISVDTGPIVALDGGGGLGHWQLHRAAELGSTRCAEYGIAAVSVANSGHCGALGVYVLPALARAQIALVFSTGPAVMAPWGAATPLLSTSPLAAGIPCRPRPAIIDLASSAVARGRIAAHARRGEPLPEGWALDADGHPTTDASAALMGMLAPLGGAKGYAIALLVESLTGAMVGPRLAGDVTDMFAADDADRPQAIGHLIVTLDPGRLSADGADAAQARLDELAARIAAAGGRLPGAARRMPDELDPDEPLAIDSDLEATLRGELVRH